MIIGTMLVKNEANRYLEKALETYKKACDKIVILDDGSTDNTVEICKKYGAIVYTSTKSMFEINESVQRQKMWELACANAEDGDWILCIDADEELTNAELIKDVCGNADLKGRQTIALRKYDMWNKTHYRDDKLWNAHTRYTPVAHKYIQGNEYKYSGWKLHGGSFPLSAYTGNIVGFDGIKWLHWAYSKAEDRVKKYEWYKQHDTDGNGSQAQYDSIIDEDVSLKKIGVKILIGSPIRQDEETFIEYLKSLDELVIPSDAEVDRYFLLNDCEHIAKHLNPNEYEILNTLDEYVTNEQTHIWSKYNLSKMSLLRNRLIQKVLEEGYDYFFMVDSDLILHPNTLVQLLSTGKELVAEIFWTEGEPGSKTYWPNCWDYDQCTFEKESIKRWLQPGLYEVGGTGACFLISREVLERGVNYTEISNVRCFYGEDRFFCIRAICNGYKIYIDTNYPATHLYRPSLYEQYMKEKYGGGNVNGD